MDYTSRDLSIPEPAENILRYLIPLEEEDIWIFDLKSLGLNHEEVSIVPVVRIEDPSQSSRPDWLAGNFEDSVHLRFQTAGIDFSIPNALAAQSKRHFSYEAYGEGFMIDGRYTKHGNTVERVRITN